MGTEPGQSLVSLRVAATPHPSRASELHQDHVRIQLSHQLNRLAAIAGLTANVDSAVVEHQLPARYGPKQLMTDIPRRGVQD
jgi:hypothetical protein